MQTQTVVNSGAQVAPMAKTTTPPAMKNFTDALTKETPAESGLPASTFFLWRKTVPRWARWVVTQPRILRALVRDAEAAGYLPAGTLKD